MDKRKVPPRHRRRLLLELPTGSAGLLAACFGAARLKDGRLRWPRFIDEPVAAIRAATSPGASARRINEPGVRRPLAAPAR